MFQFLFPDARSDSERDSESEKEEGAQTPASTPSSERPPEKDERKNSLAAAHAEQVLQMKVTVFSGLQYRNTSLSPSLKYFIHLCSGQFPICS